MPRFQPVDPAHATGRAKDLLDGVKKQLGVVPNLLRTLAQAPAALETYLAEAKALSGGALSARLREQIALAVAGRNACDYCASAHTFIGGQLGVEPQELGRNLDGASADPKTAAALVFARAVVDAHGHVADADFAAVRDAGWSDPEIVEIVAVVVHNIFTNYFNHIFATEIDFPVVRTRAA
jgi:uncharacterized peroxidase-related enzyme